MKAPVIDAGDNFGFWVALSDERLAVGAPWESGGAGPDANLMDNTMPESGAVYLFSLGTPGGSAP